MKIIKFDLPINGTKVKNLQELRDNLTDEILALARSSQLERWLRTRQLPEQAQAVAAAVQREGTDKGLFLALCKVLEVEAHPDDVRAIFDAPPAPGKFIHDSRYFEYKEVGVNNLKNKIDNKKTIPLNKIIKYRPSSNIVTAMSRFDDKSKFGSACIMVARIHAKEGSEIEIGDLIFEMDDGKSISKVRSSVAGIVQNIFVKVGGFIKIDQDLVSIAETEA